MRRDDGGIRARPEHRHGREARELTAHGWLTYKQLTTTTPRELLGIHGVGPKAVRILTEELAERGLAFRPD